MDSTSEGRLFDPTPYQRPGAVAKDERQPRAVKPPPETVPVLTSSLWKLVVSKDPGVVHAVKSGPHSPYSSYITLCNRAASARTFDPGVEMHGCAACAART